MGDAQHERLGSRYTHNPREQGRELLGRMAREKEQVIPLDRLLYPDSAFRGQRPRLIIKDNKRSIGIRTQGLSNEPKDALARPHYSCPTFMACGRSSYECWAVLPQHMVVSIDNMSQNQQPL